MSKRIITFFSSPWSVVLTGAIIGLLGALLPLLGNPANMGICIACFERDIAGALGLHRASSVQQIRPEIIGIVLGSSVTALIFREFKARTGSAPIIRFLLGAFGMIGALAFLGCPWRALLRLAGGDLNAIIGMAGLAAGIGLGVLFLRSGYSLGRSFRTPAAVGWIMPIFMIGLLLLAIFQPQLVQNGPIFSSTKGPGSQHAFLLISLGAGVLVGFLAQRSRFCTMGAIRDVILIRDTHLISGVGALLIVAFATNLILSRVNFSFANQPVAHSSHLWNFLGMALAGLAFSLAGGCPGRQLILAGEGDGDAAIFVLGMITGSAFAHNFGLSGSPDRVVDGHTGGLETTGMIAVILGIVACLLIGFFMRERFAKGVDYE